MESQNKVMTVSYGTFSCTLDGFDDPFTTMKHVAEYFRKLAAEDRYFGGEPLQPDANNLYRIAQDENPYEVDAEVTETGITLRKADVVDAPTQAEEVTSIAPAPEHAPAVDVKAVAEPTPLFTSRRNAPDTIDTIDVEDEIAAVDEDTASFVAATMFSSHRNGLTPAIDEPEISAAELLSKEDEIEEEDKFEPALADETDVQDYAEVTEDEAIKNQITQEVKTAKREKLKVKEGDDIQREEEALERLLETTNTKLDNPAHTRKSNALERLKAAVAATEAERRVRGNGKTERPKVQDLENPAEFKSRMSEVRRNHEEVVKISRPTAEKAGQRARRSFATLILGNEQRVTSNDAAEAAAPVKKPEADVQPIAERTQDRAKPALKIVRPTSDEEQQTAPRARPSDFMAFADKLGANSLHDLLEASAAYLAIVEEEPRFSQNRILENISGFMTENQISKESANRSLDRLMRDGLILRVKQDSYTMSKSAKHGYRDRMTG